jgi:DNA-binding NarL/FixJ family response regulator
VGGRAFGGRHTYAPTGTLARRPALYPGLMGLGDEGKHNAFRVVVADDDRLTALTLTDSLARYGLLPVGVAHNAGQALANTLSLKPDALVVDLDFGPGPTGLDVAVKARRALPGLGVVMVTAYEDPRLLAPRLPAAPEGTIYLVKQQLAHPEQVAAAVRLAVGLALDPPKKKLTKLVDLTDAQIELLRLVALGLSNQAIAAELTLTPETVKKSITRLAKRLGVDHTGDTNIRVGLTHRYLQYSGHSRG